MMGWNCIQRPCCRFDCAKSQQKAVRTCSGKEDKITRHLDMMCNIAPFTGARSLPVPPLSV